MIITIDTKKDTKEDIQLAIKLLKEISEDSAEGFDVAEESGNAFGAVFSDDKEKEDKDPDDVEIVPY